MDKKILGRIYSRLIHKYFLNDLHAELRVRARQDTVDYIEAHLKNALLAPNRPKLLQLCMQREKEAALDGLILEFGVAGGVTARIIGAAAAPRTVHGFDSFEGLPGDWSGTADRKGSYTQHGKLPTVPANVKLHKGWFNETLPAFLASNPGPVSFVNMDADVYDSTRYVLDQLVGRFKIGTVIHFDEYYNYPNWREHEYKAWQEIVKAHGIEYRYFFSVDRYHAAVQITKIE